MTLACLSCLRSSGAMGEGVPAGRYQGALFVAGSGSELLGQVRDWNVCVDVGPA
jgi:hypothetical protein